jgi:hypothetical protein
MKKRCVNHQERREISKKPKIEEHEGMPQHQHCPLAKHRKKNPKYHEKQHRDVA